MVIAIAHLAMPSSGSNYCFKQDHRLFHWSRRDYYPREVVSFPEDETLRAKSAGERVAPENIALIGVLPRWIVRDQRYTVPQPKLGAELRSTSTC